MSAADLKDLQDVFNAFSGMFMWLMVITMILTDQKPQGVAKALWWIAMVMGCIAGLIRVLRFFL